MLKNRTIEVISPIPEFQFQRMIGVETLGRLFEFDIDLVSTIGSLPLSAALGKPMTIAMSMGDKPPRFFNGVVARLALVGFNDDGFRYRAKLRPWLWLLSKTTNSRIFQSKDFPTLIDVLKAVFEPYGESFDVEGVHHGDFPCPEYLVQYQETDLNFVSRLMEQAGIYYFFRHDAATDTQPGKHTLMLFAGLAVDAVKGYEQIEFFTPGASRALDPSHEHLDSWSIGFQVEPGAFVAKEFDFTNPRAPLLSASLEKKNHPHDNHEVFEYPGRYIDDDQRQSYAIRRRQELQLGFEVARGTGTARGITPGFLFTMTGYPADEHNREYVVTSASYSLATNDSSSGDGEQFHDFRCGFDALDSHVIYRTPLTSPRPEVDGPQTAIVVGPKTEEIWTDKLGRVKVQFHWDREGKHNENSSCFVRVAQVWAGANWGAIHIPRIGQEVIVDFLDGDPDRPIITGRVYNADNPVPYKLPDHQTQSGIKSRSTPKGSPTKFNEIRFEDLIDHEELFIQAERDHTTKVKRNRSASVGADDSVSVGGDRNVTVSGNLKVTVNGGGKGSPQSHLDVTGEHWLTASTSIDINAPTYINLACGESFIFMEPGKITMGVGKKGRIVIDDSVFAKSAEDKSSIKIDSSGEAKMVATTNAIVNGKTVAANAETTADLNGDMVTASGKTQTLIKGGSNASVKAYAAGVDVLGTLIKMNS